MNAAVHRQRRARLASRVRRPILLMGGERISRNLPMIQYPFRQDSSFLWATGCSLPGAACIIEPDGHSTLFLPEPAEDDALWHGPQPSLQELGAQHGMDAVQPARELPQHVGTEHATLATSDARRSALASRLTGRKLVFGHAYGDEELVQAIIELRRRKQPEEIEALREAARLSSLAHRAVIRACHPGGEERQLAALFQAVLAAHGCELGYGLILTQRGDVLHMAAHDQPLRAGELLLVDAGGELATGYGADITRTFPVSGRFSPRQRAASEAVLAAQQAAIQACRPGVRFREVHDLACLHIARFLADEGLITVSPEEAVRSGAHAVFFPHGVGHHLGLDVHDMEYFGDLPSYPADASRPKAFGTRYLRLDLPLEAGWVLTIEPGFYVVPAILQSEDLREALGARVNWERAAEWMGLGGIRIEDDVHITADGPDVLSAGLEKRPEELETLVGSGRPAGELLC